MQKHSSLIRGNTLPANKSLWPDCAIEADPYRLPAHIAFDVPVPAFSGVAGNRTVTIYKSFVVIVDRLGQQSTTMRIVALCDFDAIVVRVGFSSHGYRQIGSAVYLHHAGLGYDLPLYAADDCSDTAAFWNSWSRVLGIPAMTVDKDGSLIDPFDRVGKLHVCRTLRRRPTAGLTDFRPAFRRLPAYQQRRMVETASGSRSGARRDNSSNVYRLFS